MRSSHRILIVAILLAIVMSVPAGAVVKVTRSLNVFELYGSFAKPLGTYDGVPGDDFGAEWEFDADSAYDAAFMIGMSYGRLTAYNVYGTVGFRYTAHALRDTLRNEIGHITWPLDAFVDFPDVKQFDLTLDLNYVPFDLFHSGWSPHAGLGVRAGLTTIYFKGYDSQSELNVALAANFGAEVKLYNNKEKRTFVTLASVNSWEFMASGNRPHYLTIGGALRYYFKL